MAKGKNVLKTAYHDEHGRERCSSIPIVENIDLRRSESTDERIRRILNSTLSQKMLERGEETFDEANDFDVEDDFDKPEIESRYPVMQDEYVADPPPPTGGGEADPAPVQDPTPQDPPAETPQAEQ